MVSTQFVLSCMTLATFLTTIHLGHTDEAPSFLKEPTSQVVKRNSRVRLKCEVLPKDALVTWTFNRETLQNDLGIEFRHSQLIIKSFQAKGQGSHVGEYQCYVQTSIGKIVSRIARLKLAYIKKFTSPIQETTSVYLGGTAIINCTPPDSNPPAIIEYQFKSKYLSQSSDHHMVLPSGSLQIHNATADDVGEYTCTAVNPLTGKRKTADSNTELVLNTDSHQQHSIIYANGASVFIGETAILQCVSAGTPHPRIRWFRNDKEMPDSLKYKWGNLIIENVRKHDRGSFFCESQSGDRVIQQEINLDVKIRPAIRSPPKDTAVTPGDNVSLKCGVVGEEDEIKWLFNTSFINPRNIDYIADGHQLTIQGVSLKHLGMYQCYVENELGSSQASAELKFKAGYVFPSFLAAPINTTAIERETILLVCGISGDPIPFGRWLNPRNEQVKSAGRFYINGEPQTANLIIQHVQPGDEGWYTCVIENSLGNISAKAYLKVEMLVATQPTPRTTKPIIAPVEGGAVSDEAQISPTNNALHTVKLGAVPNAPGTPNISEVNATSVDIRWTYKDNPDAPVREFVILMMMVNSKEGWHNITDAIAVDKRIYRILNLTSGNTYRFKVIAANQIGRTSSENSHRFLIGDDTDVVQVTLAPIEKPVITKCLAASSTSIQVGWKYNSESETQPVDGFYILHRADSNNDDYESKTIESMETIQFLIENLSPDMLYDIKMQTFNVAGTGPYSNIMSESTDAPVKAPIYKPEYYVPATRQSPIDIEKSPEMLPATDKQEILYICIGVVLGAMVIIFIIFAGMCIWRMRQTDGNIFGGLNWSQQGYYGRTPPYTKGSDDSRYINGHPVYDQRYQVSNSGSHTASKDHLEPRPLYMMPQDTHMPIDVSQYLNAHNDINWNGSTTLGHQCGKMDHRHPCCVRPVKREDLRLTPNGVVCQPSGTCSNRNLSCHDNNDILCHSNNDVNKIASLTSHNSLVHDSIDERHQLEVPPNATSINVQQRQNKSSDSDVSYEEGPTTSKCSSANSNESMHSIVESDV